MRMRLRLGMSFLFVFKWKRFNGFSASFSCVCASMKLHIFLPLPLLSLRFAFRGFVTCIFGRQRHWRNNTQTRPTAIYRFCAECSFICVNLWQTHTHNTQISLSTRSHKMPHVMLLRLIRFFFFSPSFSIVYMCLSDLQNNNNKTKPNDVDD